MQTDNWQQRRKCNGIDERAVPVVQFKLYARMANFKSCDFSVPIPLIN